MTSDTSGSGTSGAEGARAKQRITDGKSDRKTEPFDPGASMLGTDDEAGAAPAPDEMAQARKAPAPAPK